MDNEQAEDPGAGLRLEVPADQAGARLDRWLPAALEGAGVSVSRAAVQQWIREGAVLRDGERVKPRQPLAAGDAFEVRVPAEEAPSLPEGEDIPLVVLHEDEDIVVVDKPPGLVVHPGSGNPRGTLVNALLHHCGGKLCALAGEDRPGIVHRLDKETSGCLVAAKSERAYRSLVAQFSGREAEKIYLAVTDGVPVASEGRIDNRIGRHPVHRQRMAVLPPPAGKEAVTEYRVLRAAEDGSWATLSCRILTGRTHQIRVHLKECLRRPVLGDALYGRPSRQRTQTDRLMLHARRLGLRHPATGEALAFEAPPPPEFAPFL